MEILDQIPGIKAILKDQGLHIPPILNIRKLIKYLMYIDEEFEKNKDEIKRELEITFVKNEKNEESKIIE